ncbi:MAG: sugar ABC transporter ATP-binding protein [Anaerolineae bacterium]|nr:sugar ABC transporter ATP-binding protein [Anaerolineae bacterium]
MPPAWTPRASRTNGRLRAGKLPKAPLSSWRPNLCLCSNRHGRARTPAPSLTYRSLAHPIRRLDVATIAQQPVLQVNNVSKAFPGVQALDKVSFRISPGEVVALVGENGAGKSTLMKILSGAYRMDTGEIEIEGARVVPENPRHAQDLGIAIIYQEFNLTPNQTVATNIFLAREPERAGFLGRLGLVDYGRMREATAKLLDRVGARFSPDALVLHLSVAERQMVEIAKALAVDAQIIIMDEPTSALGREEVEVLFDIVRNLKAQGIAVIFITHRLEEVFVIADRVVVLRDGKYVGEMPITDADRDKIISLMVGRPIDQVFQREMIPESDADIVLEVRGLTRKGIIEDISFDLKRGEILGVAGLVGSGRTEMARAIFGADPIDAGEIRIAGQPVQITSPLEAVVAGLALVPENRQTEGLILMHSVEMNVIFPNLDDLSNGEFVRQQYARGVVQQAVDQLSIRTPSLQQKTRYLSGGNQQKTVLAKWLTSDPKVLIMDEPTRGIDVGAKAEVYVLMDRLAKAGIGIIMISSELPEILQMSDRILVMHEGRAVAVLDKAEADQEVIMSYASGQEQQ